MWGGGPPSFDADVLHGHGAKGGAYVRLASSRRAIRVIRPMAAACITVWGSPTACSI